MNNTRFNRTQQCTVCQHPGREEIDRMLLLGDEQFPYSTIIGSMKAQHPDANAISKSALTRHKQKHAMNKPITVTTVDGEQVTLHNQSASRALSYHKESIPDTPSLQDALNVIITAGMVNILSNPALVGPKELIAAIEVQRKMGGNQERDELEKAWEKLTSKRTKKTTTREVRVRETVETDAGLETAAPDNVVEGEYTVEGTNQTGITRWEGIGEDEPVEGDNEL